MWTEIAAQAASKLIKFGVYGAQDGTYALDWNETTWVFSLWSSKRTNGQWGQSVGIALDLEDQKKIYVVADDFQPWGDGSELPLILKIMSVEDLPIAAQVASEALKNGVEDFFPQLMENECTGGYQIERSIR
jgi:hypothetical protein